MAQRAPGPLMDDRRLPIYGLRVGALALCVAALIVNALCLAYALPGLGIALVLQGAGVLAMIWQWYRSRELIDLHPSELAERLLQAQERERQHLSRELHDDIGQLLTAATLQIAWLRRRLPEDCRDCLDILSGTLGQTLEHVRDVAALLNPRQLARLGLEGSLRAQLLHSLSVTDIRWSLDCQQRLNGLDEAVAMAVFRITQEAVTNVVRHAAARNLTLQVQRTPAGLTLRIEDDGRGFIPAENPAQLGQRGLAGMHERVAALGGELRVSSQPGGGTRIVALFPWAQDDRGRAQRAMT